MKLILKSTLSIALCSLLFATPLQAKKSEPLTYNTETVSVATVFEADPSIKLTLEQIMADPDWLGRQPERAFWSADSKTVFYQRKQQGNENRDWFERPLDGTDNGQLVSLSQVHTMGAANAVFNRDKTIQAYTFADNLFVRNMASGKITQLTQDSAKQSGPQFLLDGRLAYRQGWQFFAIDLSTGLRSELANLKTEQAPEAPTVAKGYLAQEQHKLINYVALSHKNKLDRHQSSVQLQQQNKTLTPQPIYLGKGIQIVEASLSPAADFIVLATRKATKRNDKDIMPNYITANGDVAAQPVRARVNDASPEPQKLWLVNLNNGEQSELSYASLPGYNEDVLASVKAENAKAKGEKYKSEKIIRDIGLMNDWYWSQGAIRWHASGEQVAVMLKAFDNKDRWLATIDLKKQRFVPQHRLHDTAWVNYAFNDFGWLNNSQALYYLSEESGYAHLYLKTLTGKAQKLTKGTFEVSEPTLTQDDNYIYFKANMAHPGQYNVYRANLATNAIEQVTNLVGSTSFTLSPDETKLLLRYSTNLLPEELYVAEASPAKQVIRLTDTVSEQFKALPLVAPKIVAVKSSRQAKPIFSKVYQPTTDSAEKRRAVVFSHGAGYLQNSDMGWSGYFREFLFHNLLVQHGYVVMDMDYRASKGYGRDWRTAIYRHMGKPEIEDLADGVDWLVKNANVDRQRIGTYGGSYGGFMTFMALFTQPDLFQAGAALRPVTDWAYYNQPYTANILNTPSIDPIAYERSSPIYFSQGLTKPLLINAPMVDDNVFFQDSVRLVQRLIEQENPNFEIALYPVEAHGFRQPSSWLDEYRRIFKLFEQNL